MSRCFSECCPCICSIDHGFGRSTRGIRNSNREIPRSLWTHLNLFRKRCSKSFFGLISLSTFCNLYLLLTTFINFDKFEAFSLLSWLKWFSSWGDSPEEDSPGDFQLFEFIIQRIFLEFCYCPKWSSSSRISRPSEPIRLYDCLNQSPVKWLLIHSLDVIQLTFMKYKVCILATSHLKLIIH